MEQLAVTVSEACAAARVGRTSLYAAIQRGDLVAAKLGRKTLIRVDDLRAWLARLPPVDISSSGCAACKAAGRETGCEF